MTLQIGDHVRVKGTLLYNGRVGTLLPTSKQPDDPWDFNVHLFPDDNHDMHRTIGVHEEQVELIE